VLVERNLQDSILTIASLMRSEAFTAMKVPRDLSALIVPVKICNSLLYENCNTVVLNLLNYEGVFHLT
jgi:hypothetical protein